MQYLKRYLSVLGNNILQKFLATFNFIVGNIRQKFDLIGVKSNVFV